MGKVWGQEQLRRLLASHSGTQGHFFYLASVLAREGNLTAASAYAIYRTYAKYRTGQMRDYHA